MENASKALIMAGGILIALLIIGALLLLVNNLGSYQNSEKTNVKVTQLASFNQQFEKYTATNEKGIQGTDIISLANKVANYNKIRLEKSNDIGANAVDYDIELKLTIKNIKAFNAKYATNELFKKDVYIITDINELPNIEKSQDKTKEQEQECKEFKTSTFKCSAGYPKYKNGQIYELCFEFVK